MARQRVPPGPPAPPPVQRLRLRYAKRGRLRFSSTRDFQRALERAVRRARLPMAFSSGFHPHPKISYANAAPTGTASEAEYVEIGLVQRMDPRTVREVLDEALPDGLDVLEVVEAGPGSLAEPLEASAWQVEFGCEAAATRPTVGLLTALRRACEEYLALDVAEVTRTVKGAPRTFDTRAAVVRLAVLDVPDGSEPWADPSSDPGLWVDATGGSSLTCAILHMVVRNTTPAVRPDDILTALRRFTALDFVASLRVTRLAQGPLNADATVADPWPPQSEVTGARDGDAPTRADPDVTT
ncbi:MAG: TIGR03936 family radical SAM-associated protein [Dermatophilaceae bacterium]